MAALRRMAVLLGVLVLLSLLVYGLLAKAEDGSIDAALAAGKTEPGPLFELELLDEGSTAGAIARRLGRAGGDQRIALEELRGLPVVLNFWASWCLPCREEAPILQRGWERHRGRVLFLGLNTQDLTDDARSFIEEFEITYPTIRDPGKEVSSAYGLTGIPETFFIDARGRVVGHVIGVVSRNQLDRGVEAARRGEVAGVLAGGAQGGRS